MYLLGTESSYLYTVVDQYNIRVPLTYTQDGIVQEEQQYLLWRHILVADMTLPAVANKIKLNQSYYYYESPNAIFLVTCNLY